MNRSPRRAAGLFAVLGPAVVAGALIATASLLTPQAPNPRPVPEVAPLRSLTCPAAAPKGSLTASDQKVTVTGVDGKSLPDPFRAGAVRAPLVITHTGPGAVSAGVYGVEGTDASWTECGAPAVSGEVLVPNPAEAELVLANPDRVNALVNITLDGPTGRLEAMGLRDVTVPANSVVRIPLSVHAPAGAPVAVIYTTSQGRVQVASSLTHGGAEQAAAVVPAADQVFAAVPPADRVRLLLHNPGEVRARVQVSAIGMRGRFEPEGGSTSIEPGATVALDLSKPLQGQLVSLQVQSSSRISGLVEAAKGKDLAWMVGQEPALKHYDVTMTGTLQVVNPGVEEARVTITTPGGKGEHTIPAGGAGNLQVTTGAVTITSSRPVAAGVEVTGRGLLSTRIRGNQAAVRPAPVQLDPQLGQG